MDFRDKPLGENEETNVNAVRRGRIATVLHDIRFSWKELVLTDITYKVLALLLLTPIIGILFRVLVALSGRSVIADEDILHFALEPMGWICIIAVGALSIAMIALEQAALMGIVCAANHERHLSVLAALRFAAAHAWPVLRVTARIMMLALLASAPLLAAAGAVYVLLLTEFDINYYLAEKPSEFWLAVGLGGVIAGALVIIWLRLATSWFYALPLVMFEEVEPRQALKVSRDRVTGHRPKIVLWIIGWLVATLLLSALATGIVVLLAKLIVPRLIGSLALLLFAVGATLVAWASVNLATNVLSTTSFAVVFFRLYADLGGGKTLDISRLAAEAADMRGKGPKFTRKRLAIALAAGIVLAAAVGGFAIRTVRTEDRTEIVAHRGASAAAPENTMAAVRQAVEEGTDWVEIDVQETADGEVVVLHDSDFKKVAGVDLKIWDATMADLKNIDIGSFFSPEYNAERPPRLADVLAFCKGKAKVVIELKYYGHDQRLEERVAELVEAHDMQSDIAVMSLKQQGIDKMKALRPAWQVGLLTAVTASDLTRAKADFLAVNANIATRRFIRSAHDQNKNVLVWTVNDPVSMSTIIGRGADGLITDKPALARDVLAQRAKLSSVERLLIELAGMLGVKREVVGQ